ncbi:MAG: dTDP-4-dehydrorhamnose 3,5-epimerase [Omnitrophica WOR_2 bacterium RIFCSPLOWO2_02_FULL_45_28]|nr:MAG: dTDP-4-dehydrorhamnose 3,5-epimerase [Omnitrophica WOR_2 bacterium RIFCSPLOWO2_02_FULL_45_28]
MIEGVKIKKLKLLTDERGRLMELLRRDDGIFSRFGQVYFTTAYPNAVKAWHYHKKQDDYFACVKGAMRLALYDARTESKTYKQINEFKLGLHNPLLVKIPRNVYHGFKCISADEAMVINVPTAPYNYRKPDEYRLDPYDNDIPYNWRK